MKIDFKNFSPLAKIPFRATPAVFGWLLRLVLTSIKLMMFIVFQSRIKKLKLISALKLIEDILEKCMPDLQSVTKITRKLLFEKFRVSCP